MINRRIAPRLTSVIARKAATVLAAFLTVLSIHTATAAPRSDITIGMQLEPPHLDPTSAAAGAIDQVLYANLFEGLTRFAADGAIVPGLARSWQISPDGRIYEFTLNQDVRFHDGTGMDAEDVKFSLDRARAENSTNAQKALFAGITSVEAVSPHLVRITLDQPNGQLLFNLAWGDAVIVAPESIADIRTNPVGTGPFSF